MPNPHEWSLVVPFLDDSPEYARGVEFGMVYTELRDTDATEYANYVSRANQDQVLLAASRLGWFVAEMTPHDGSWFWLRLERR